MAGPRKIPVARRMLEGLIVDMTKAGADPRFAQVIQLALPLMHRAKYARHASARHRGWSDPALKSDILHVAALQPDWTLQEISVACNTTTGRVSEAVNGLV